MEDLHHAGPDLLAFLRFAAADPDRSARLLVLTSRPTPVVEDLGRDDSLRSFHLGPLPDDATVRMVEAILGPGTLPAPFVRTIAEQSQGNPLFVEELFRSWAQAGVLQVAADGGWQFSGSATTDRLPTTVQSLYLGQLDGLPD